MKKSDKELIYESLWKHGDDFWEKQPKNEMDSNVYLLEDILSALAKEGYDLQIIPLRRLPDYILEILRERHNLESDDTSRDQEFHNMYPKDVFKHVVEWYIGDAAWVDDMTKWARDTGYNIKED